MKMLDKWIYDSKGDDYITPDDYTPVDDTTDKPSPRRRRRLMVWSLTILLIVLGVAFWLRYCNPYVTDATEQGFLLDVERRGVVIKTWEGTLIVTRAINDNTHMYQREFVFSVNNDSLARRMQQYRLEGLPVKLEYNRYFGTLPWRGSSTCVVTGVEAVYPDKQVD